MPDEIFEGLDIPFAETCFLTEQNCTHLVYGTKNEAYGSDQDNELRRITVTAELFEAGDAPDPAAHARLRRRLDEDALSWVKEERVFYSDVRLFETTYIFEYLERRN